MTSKVLSNVTNENTKWLNYPMKYVTFNMDTSNVGFISAQQGYIKNYDIHFLDLNSDKEDLGVYDMISTREARELKIFFLKR